MDYEASMDKKFDEGKIEGLQEGEKKMQVQIAQNMLKQGLSIQNIASATGLSTKEVKKFQEETKTPSI
jgi:predicted transposase/invertase (TIGR01784 family)